MASTRTQPVYRFGEFVLDLDARTLRRGGVEVALRPKTFDLLAHLVVHGGRVMSKDELFDAVWANVTVGEDSLTQCVSELRRVLGENGAALIRTVPRRGYVFSAPVLDMGPEAAEPPPSLPDRPSLAVLPFANLSSDLEQDFFAAGMTEDLTAALSLIRELLVVSRGVGAAGLDGSTPPDRVAQDLGVRYLLEGSVRVSGERIRVSARLLDSETGGQIWAERFDGVRGDVFAFQDEITRAIAVALQIRLTHGEMARLWDGQTRDLRAWEKFIVGRDIHMSFTEAGNRQGQALLQEALEIDPDYTAAMVMLGITYWEDARDYSSIPPDEALARAEAQAERALALAPGLAGAYSLRGGIAFMRDRHDEAVALCRRACELAPSDPWNHAFLALISIYADEPQVALDALSMAFRLSPHPPGWFFFQKAQAHLWEGALDRAVDAAKRYRALAPDDPYGRALLATIHAFAGREAEAAATIRELRRHDPRFSLADIRRAQRYKDPAKLDRVVEALRRAGLPG